MINKYPHTNSPFVFKKITGSNPKAYEICDYTLNKRHEKCVTFILHANKLQQRSTEAVTQRGCISAENRTSVAESGALCAL